MWRRFITNSSAQPICVMTLPWNEPGVFLCEPGKLKSIIFMSNQRLSWVLHFWLVSWFIYTKNYVWRHHDACRFGIKFGFFPTFLQKLKSEVFALQAKPPKKNLRKLNQKSLKHYFLHSIIVSQKHGAKILCSNVLSYIATLYPINYTQLNLGRAKTFWNIDKIPFDLRHDDCTF